MRPLVGDRPFDSARPFIENPFIENPFWGESHPHFHAHRVPRYATMPRDAKAWSVFDLQRAVAAGEIPIDRAEVARICEAYRRALLAE